MIFHSNKCVKCTYKKNERAMRGMGLYIQIYINVIYDNEPVYDHCWRKVKLCICICVDCWYINIYAHVPNGMYSVVQSLKLSHVWLGPVDVIRYVNALSVYEQTPTITSSWSLQRVTLIWARHIQFNDAPEIQSRN